MNKALRSSILMWGGVLVLVLNAIGAISSLDILSGIVLWIATHWTELVRLAFTGLYDLIGIRVPIAIQNTIVYWLALGSIVAACFRSYARQVRTANSAGAGPQRISAKSYIFGVIGLLSVVMFVACLSIAGPNPVVLGVSFGLLAFFVIVTIPHARKLSKSYVAPRAQMLIDAFKQVTVQFWVGFIILFLVGAWSWIVETGETYGRSIIDGIESEEK